MNTLRPAVMLGRGVMSGSTVDAVERQHLVLLRFLPEERLQLLELFGILRRDIVGLRPVLAEVVELPRPARRIAVSLGTPLSHGGRITLVLAIQPS